MKTLIPCALAALVGFAAIPARADTVPDLDVEKTCRSARAADPTVDDKASYDGCINSERNAKKQAEQHWGSFPTTAKKQCEAQFKAGGYPSYVEMITCLELASGSVPSQSSDGDIAVGGKGSAKAGGAPEGSRNLTAEPSPAQRTDPIKVLKNQ
jgi:hypothetical protein